MTALRIGLDARYVYDHFPGIGRVISQLAAALSNLLTDQQLVILYHPQLPNTRYDLQALADHPQVELVACPIAPFSLAEQTQLPLFLRRLRLDLLHSPYYIKPYFGLPCPSVVTIYDLIGRRFPQTLSWRGRLLFEWSTRLALRTSRAVLTISEHARNDLFFDYRIPRERITVTPLAADPRFQPQTSDQIADFRVRYQIPEQYVLYLGSNKPHKNLERLVRAWERLCNEGHNDGVRLLIAGHVDPRYGEIPAFVAERGLSERVRFLPNVPEADLPTLYSGALLFAFPSYYEGFGLPPLEAMACGTPVLCAYASSLPEVVGEAALTVDPYSFLEMAEGLRRLIYSRPLRSRLRKLGLERAKLFNWERTAEATLAVYEAEGKRKLR